MLSEIQTIEAHGTSYTETRYEPEVQEDLEPEDFPLRCGQCDFSLAIAAR